MNQIAIVGAGMVGLALANQLADAGFAVTVFEKSAPDLNFNQASVSVTQRVSALNLSTRDLLQKIAVWQDIRPLYCQPFKAIEAWSQGTSHRVTFAAADIAKKYLGYIVENRELVRALWCRAMTQHTISLQVDASLNSLDELRHQFDLVIGADGAQSWVRQAAGITCKEQSYGQKAIVATIESTEMHQAIAYQSFLPSGPLGVLPLTNAHHESIVWSAEDHEAERLMSLGERSFNRELTNAFEMRLGRVQLLGKRHLFPLVRRQARQFVQPGLALVGDAAHTIHPLAGQGVNLGFDDTHVLSQILSGSVKQGKAINDYLLLKRYQRQRNVEVQKMQLAMALFRYHGRQLALGFGFVDKFEWLKQKITAAVE